jgi:lipopolysaccharide transport system permease protein
VFSRVAHFEVGDVPYSVFVLSGMVAWAYMASTLNSATTAIVDGSSLADKVWFPRLSLVVAPVLANAVSLAISVGVLLVVLAPLMGAPLSWHIVVLLPAMVLVAAFVLAVGLVTSALQVYFRDVKFIVQAGLLVWFYATPIIYPASALGRLEPLAKFNPMTGVVALFNLAASGHADWTGPTAITLATTAVFLVIGVEAHRRHDRLFVDLL